MSNGVKTSVFALGLAAFLMVAILPHAAESDFDNVEFDFPFGALRVSQDSLLQAKSPKPLESAPIFLMYVTAYSSSADETDSTPDVTASGTRVRDGVVASNLFSFGTRIRIPGLFGNKIFLVEDRMSQRFGNRIDVWMPSKGKALRFGKQMAEVKLVES